MPQEVIDKIFEPFFTTKDIGKGTGLGVSISYGIVKDYDGDIKIKSEVGKGTSFELRFPVAN
jgi:histidine kinase